MRVPWEKPDSFPQSVAWVYLGVGTLSVLGVFAVAYIYYLSPAIQRDHASTLILIITMMDFAFTMKFMVGALAWVCGDRDTNNSFHLLPDQCITSAMYGQFFGMVRAGPLRGCALWVAPGPSSRFARCRRA